MCIITSVQMLSAGFYSLLKFFLFTVEEITDENDEMGPVGSN